MHLELGWILLGLAAAAGVIGIAAPAERPRIRHTWILTGTALVMWVSGRLASAPLWLGESAMALSQIVGVHLGALLLFGVLLRRLRVPRLVSDIGIGAGYAVVLLGLLSRVGVNLTGIIATSAVLTAVIGLSIQDMLANLVGGVVLEVERSILAGDWIRTDQGVGQVRDVRLRHTAIETPDGDTVIIPNRVLTLSPVTVLGRVQESTPGKIKHRKFINFYLSYGHSPTEVTQAVEQALVASPLEGVAADPRPRCLVMGYHPHSVEYATLTWMTRPGMEFADSSGVRTRIHYALARLGVPLISIVQPVELHYSSQPAGSMPHGAAALRGVGMFSMLDAAEIEQLAAKLSQVTFAPGEVILRQNDEGDSLYILARGRVRILLSSDAGGSEQLALLSPGDFFGEMSLMTGERRTATAIAEDEVECYRLCKESLSGLLERQPKLADDISAMLASRQEGLVAAREALDDETRRRSEMERRKDFRSRIQAYFGL